jgi:hypothetical protein
VTSHHISESQAKGDEHEWHKISGERCPVSEWSRSANNAPRTGRRDRTSKPNNETGYRRDAYFLENRQEGDHPSGNEEPAEGETPLFTRAKRDSHGPIEDEELKLSYNRSPLRQRESLVEEQRAEHAVNGP